jgi:cytolysin-activating lysine-acyltransferase
MKRGFDLFTFCGSDAVLDKAKQLGFACLITSMCRKYSSFSMTTLKYWICPAIDHRQILFLFDKTSTPLGYVTWAHLAADSEERLLKHLNFVINPSEWNEGGRTWIVDFCFPCGGVYEALKIIKKHLWRQGVDKIFWVRRNDDYTVRRSGSYQIKDGMYMEGKVALRKK